MHHLQSIVETGERPAAWLYLSISESAPLSHSAHCTRQPCHTALRHFLRPSNSFAVHVPLQSFVPSDPTCWCMMPMMAHIKDSTELFG